MHFVSGLLALTLAASPVSLWAQSNDQHSDPPKVTEYAKTLPPVTAQVFDEQKKEMLASFAISCADHPQENTGTRNNYLWGYEKLPLILENYDRNRAFFDCANWHDAVGDTWMLMSILRQDPKVPLASDIRDIATTHFRKGNMDGEVAFFENPRPPTPGEGVGGFTLERPYGYSWLLKLYGEAKGYTNADRREMATALAPLARWMSEKYVYYLYNLKFPLRTGTDTNTAWSMSLTLDGVNLSEDATLKGKQEILEDYDKKRAFYGCLDWHSGVNSMWMMASLIKQDPTIAVAPAIRLAFENHIAKTNIDGEMEYFKGLKGPLSDFEKPYGYASLLKLYGEAKSWNDPEGRRIAATLEPFAKWIDDGYIGYLKSLNYPVRVGLHPNTALDMIFTLDYTNETQDKATETVIHDTALRLFGNDKHCATAAEPVFGDFASPCLAEAALMGRVLTPEAYSKWLDSFLPPVYAPEFQGYAKEIDAVHGNNRDTTGTDEEGLPNAHLVGLNYPRAADLLMIANGLPKDDPRVPVYRRLAIVNAKQGYDKIGLAGYLGTHWIATYALMYENLAHLSAATPPEKLHATAAKK